MPDAPRPDSVAGFLDAQRFTREQVFAEPSPVPKAPGAYGWWFRTLPAVVDATGCEVRDGMTLLHVGISPTPPPASGKRPVSQDLHKRIRYHFGGARGNADGSSLRKTLGVLLAGELGLELRRVGAGKQITLAGGEATLNRWMSDNTEVSWVVRPEPWVFEEELTKHLVLPLNLQGDSDFHQELKRLRRDAMAKANKLRILKEW
ncbi:GIY-YIG nuclease family protein [Mycobacterium sp. NPDC006124]|uniref:GIY-YIG nuclease family protein n=1 Tax=Mycobacterium sp. NPDC006124 TaxID=3156729 RepID=UPI0033BEE80C